MYLCGFVSTVLEEVSIDETATGIHINADGNEDGNPVEILDKTLMLM